jgi:hypothetical protein
MKQQWVTMSAHMKSSDIAHVTHSSPIVLFVFHVSQVLLSEDPYKLVVLVYLQFSMLQ